MSAYKTSTKASEMDTMEHDLEPTNKMAAIDASRFVPRMWFFTGFGLLFVLSFIQIVISGSILNKQDDHHDAHDASTANAGATNSYSFYSTEQSWATGPDGVRPPGFEGKTWNDVINMARGTRVTFGANGAYTGTTYIPFLTKQLKDKFDIELEFVDKPSFELVNQATTDKDLDFLWINRRPFFEMKKNDLLYGPYAYVIPNADLFDWTSPVITTDFGVPTNGTEFPLHIANFVMAYDKKNIPTGLPPGDFPPKDIFALIKGVDATDATKIEFHPMSPFEWPGTPFLEQFVYAIAGKQNIPKFQQPFDQTFWDDIKGDVKEKLVAFNKNLYQDTTTKYKWGQASRTRELFKARNTHLSFEYAPGTVYNNKEKGTYPDNVVPYLFDGDTTKMVSNANFLTIAKTGPNKAGALVAINLAASMEHQFKRFIPNEGNWKGLQASSPYKRPVKEAGWATAFDEIEFLEGAPTIEELADSRCPEMGLEYHDAMRALFKEAIPTDDYYELPTIDRA